MATQQLQSLPIYHRLEPREFLVGSVRSGAEGATAKLSYSISDDAHILRGIRIANTYNLPEQNSITTEQIDYWRLCREIDDDQSVELTIGDALKIVNGVHQRLVCGKDGVLWSAFPHPLPIAGSRSIQIVLTRLTSYPTAINGTAIEPVAHVTLWCERLTSGVHGGEVPSGNRYG
jgi:hypothetical protein